jgi:hypothetical protein
MSTDKHHPEPRKFRPPSISFKSFLILCPIFFYVDQVALSFLFPNKISVRIFHLRAFYLSHPPSPRDFQNVLMSSPHKEFFQVNSCERDLFVCSSIMCRLINIHTAESIFKNFGIGHFKPSKIFFYLVPFRSNRTLSVSWK